MKIIVQLTTIMLLLGIASGLRAESFLSHPEQLQPDPRFGDGKVYFASNLVDLLPRFDSVMVDEPVLFLADDSPYKGLKASDMAAVSQLMRRASPMDSKSSRCPSATSGLWKNRARRYCTSASRSRDCMSAKTSAACCPTRQSVRCSRVFTTSPVKPLTSQRWLNSPLRPRCWTVATARCCSPASWGVASAKTRTCRKAPPAGTCQEQSLKSWAAGWPAALTTDVLPLTSGQIASRPSR